MGTGRLNGQNFAKSGIQDAPPNNTLGTYQVAGGWFNAVQYQVIATGDLNPADWSISQTATETGTQTVRVGSKSITRNVNISDPNDAPNQGAIYAGIVFGALNVDWLDNPGQAFSAAVNGRPGRVVSANLKFTFTASLKTKNGYQCNVTWSFNLKF